MQAPRNRPSGMTAFTIVGVGQFVSLLGTGMTQFAIALWAWELTGEATALSLVAFFSFAPMILFSPLAGALVDRMDRKWVMMFSDLGSGVATIALLALLLADNLQIWHLYAAGAFAGVFQAFQFPAYSAAVSTTVPKAQYARANAILGLAESASTVFAPIAASGLYLFIGLRGIILIDIITFSFALLTLAFVVIPTPAQTETGLTARGSLWTESLYGFRHIVARPSLLALQLVFFCGNFLASIIFVLMAPMLLARSGGDELTLGTVQSALGVGSVIGGLVLSAWGGPRRKVNGVLLGWAISGFWLTVIGLGQILPVWIIAGFLQSLFMPIINTSNQALWQAKVAPDVQGRVFSTRRLIAQITTPVAMFIAGPLADQVFEPAMMPGGMFANSLGWLVGTGPGAGMGLMFVLCGVAIIAVGLGGYLFPVVRDAETLLPDHDAASVNAEVPPAASVAPVSL